MFKAFIKNFTKSGRMSINIEDFNVVKEGRATILAPKQDKVFYNHIQQFNRDLSVMAIKAWLEQYKTSKEGTKELRGKRRKLNKDESGETKQDTEGSKEESKEESKNEVSDAPKETKDSKSEPSGDSTPFIRILEALSATGLRAIRYGHEIPNVSRIVANDLLAEAVKSINRSAEYNGLQEKVVGHQGDAIKYMGSISDSEKFHAIDLDPYGTAAPFIDSAVQLVKDNGLLLVTCTDAGVLAGNGYPEKCFALYGGNNFGNTDMGLEANHEAGIRLILGTIASAAARYKKCIEPVLSLSIDYYFRVFVRITTSPIEVKKLASNTMLAYHCVGCGHTVDQRLGRITDKKFQTPRIAQIPGENCTYCERPYHLAGPMWGGQLHDQEFIDSVLAINSKASSEVYGTRERIKGMLTLAKNELETPFYFNLNQLLSFMKAPPMAIDDFAKAIGNLGYKVSLTHAKKNCVKTNAPWESVLQVATAWLKKSNEKLVAEYQRKIEKENDEAKKEKLRQKIETLSKDLSNNPNLTSGMVGYKILETVAKADVDFETVNAESDKITKLRKLKMVRYQENPTKNWGPKSRPSNK